MEHKLGYGYTRNSQCFNLDERYHSLSRVNLPLKLAVSALIVNSVTVMVVLLQSLFGTLNSILCKRHPVFGQSTCLPRVQLLLCPVGGSHSNLPRNEDGGH